MIAIIKYNAGNVQSVQYALQRLGYEAVVTDVHSEIKSADKVIFPGVGNANAAMMNLKEKDLDTVIKQLTQPVLGICQVFSLPSPMASDMNKADTAIGQPAMERPGKNRLPLQPNGFTRLLQRWPAGPQVRPQARYA